MKRLILIAALCLAPTLAFAQAPPTVRLCNGTQPNCPLVSNSNPLPISGSFSATLSGWPGSTQTTGTPIAVTTGGVTGGLPAGTVVLATNVGTTNVAYCKLGASATTSDAPIFPNSSVAFTVGSATQLTCITSTSTTTVNMSGGAGLPTGWGGGGSGGSGSNASVSATGSAVPASATYLGIISAGNLVGWNGAVTGTVTANLGTIGTAATAANQATEISSLATIATNTGAAIPAGSANIGGVELIDSGGTNKLSISSGGAASVASVAGTARIGYVSDDPCTQLTKTNVAFSTGTSLTVLITGTSAKNTYICSLSVIASAAGFFGLKGGTTSDCSGGTPLALVGSLTAGSGMSLAANGGLTLGNGGASVVNDKAAAAQAYNVCIVISGTTNMAGNLTYVQQ